MANKFVTEISARDKSKTAFRSFRGSLKNASKSLFSFKGALSGIATSVGAMRLADATKQAIQFGAQIQITADKIGVSTEALQAFRLMAEQVAGVQSTTLDMALQRFSRRLGEADRGTGELLGTLRELGISTRDSAGNIKTTKEVLFEYADAVMNAESDQRALMMAFKAFDSEGAVLVGLLKEGGEALRESYNKALESGAILTQGATLRSKELNSALALQGQIINTQLKGIFLEFGEILVSITTKIASATKAVRQFFMSDSQKALDDLAGKTREELLPAWADYTMQLHEAKAAFNEIATSTKIADVLNRQGLKEDIETLEKIIAGIDELMLKAGSGNDDAPVPGFLKGFETGLKNIEKQLPTLEQVGMDFAKKFETGLVGAFDSIIDGTKSVSESLKDLGKMLLKEAMRMIIFRAIIAPFTGAFGDFLGSIGLPAPAKQFGGTVQKGKPYMVGEAGPELIIPGASGQVVPNSQLGGGFVQNVYIETGVAATVRSEIMNLLPAIAEVSQGSYIDNRKRGRA